MIRVYDISRVVNGWVWIPIVVLSVGELKLNSSSNFDVIRSPIKEKLIEVTKRL